MACCARQFMPKEATGSATQHGLRQCKAKLCKRKCQCMPDNARQLQCPVQFVSSKIASADSCLHCVIRFPPVKGRRLLASQPFLRPFLWPLAPHVPCLQPPVSSTASAKPESHVPSPDDGNGYHKIIVITSKIIKIILGICKWMHEISKMW